MKRKAQSQPNARKSKKQLQTVDESVNSVALQSQTTESVTGDADADGLDGGPDGGFIKTAAAACNKLQAEVSSLTSVVMEQQQKIDNIESMLSAILKLLQKEADHIPPVTVSNNSELSVSQPVMSASASSAVPLYSVMAGRGIESTAQNKLTASRLEDTVAAVYVDQHEHSRRANNIIISGLQPVPGVSDKEVASALIETEYDFVPHISYVKRLGQVLPGRIRLLLVTMKHDEASWLVDHATDLRYSVEPTVRKSIFINSDLTRAEAAAAYEIRCRRRRSREVKAARSTNNNNSDAELPARTFVNRGLRGGAATADHSSDSRSTAALRSVVIPASPVNHPLTTAATTSMQSSAPSPSIPSVNLSGAGVVECAAAMETESGSREAALSSASVSHMIYGPSTTCPTTVMFSIAHGAGTGADSGDSGAHPNESPSISAGAGAGAGAHPIALRSTAAVSTLSPTARPFDFAGVEPPGSGRPTTGSRIGQSD